jgi:hypothetical protein
MKRLQNEISQISTNLNQNLKTRIISISVLYRYFLRFFIFISNWFLSISNRYRIESYCFLYRFFHLAHPWTTTQGHPKMGCQNACYKAHPIQNNIIKYFLSLDLKSLHHSFHEITLKTSLLPSCLNWIVNVRNMNRRLLN